MQTRFDRAAYRQRAEVETVMSMIKRRQGNHVHGRTYQSQCRDLRLMVLTHNIMILLFCWVFYRALETRNRRFMGLQGGRFRMSKSRHAARIEIVALLISVRVHEMVQSRQ